MIGADVLLPRVHAMAALAAAAERSCMHVDGAVACRALLLGLALGDAGHMAAVAGKLGMRAAQRELGVALVQEVRFLPGARLMAALALRAHASGVGIDCGMAAGTVLRDLVLE